MRARATLIITSSGGAGHLQAAKAETLRVLEADPDARVIQQDVLLDWVGKRFGTFCRDKWNKAQATGDTPALEWMVRQQSRMEKVLFVPIFSSLLHLLMTQPVDRIIDTQPFGTSAIVKAIRTARHLLKKPLLLEKIVTELPTASSVHFFRPIKHLAPRERRLLRLVTTSPLTGQEESEEHFWENHCGIDPSAVCYKNFPLRPSFLRCQQQPPVTEIFLPLPNETEKQGILKTLEKGSARFHQQGKGISLEIKPSDTVSLLMLGSHPEEKALLHYTEQFIQSKKEHPHRQDLLFVFCCHYHTIQKEIINLILSDKHYPPSLTVIPLSFQEDTVIAPLLARSNATFTRSGGLTSMELLAVAKGQIWIHKSPRSELGMPPWELGNALYLATKKGARFISPSTFAEATRPFFKS